MEDNKTNKQKSDIKSGVVREEIDKVSGGMPDKKTVEQIEKVNSPKGRGRAPGSVRV